MTRVIRDIRLCGKIVLTIVFAVASWARSNWKTLAVIVLVFASMYVGAASGVRSSQVQVAGIGVLWFLSMIVYLVSGGNRWVGWIWVFLTLWLAFIFPGSLQSSTR